MSKEIIIDKSTLYRLYCIEQLNANKIAKIFNCEGTVIRNKLRKYKIKIRRKRVVISKDKLYNLYCKKGLGCTKIAKIFNCCEVTIISKLRKYKIKVRKLKVIAISKSRLYDLYINKKLNTMEIAKIFKCSNRVIFDRLKKYKIKIRTRSEARRGKNGGNWRGGFPKCVDCGEPTKDYNSKRCEKCYYEYAKGKNSNNWQGGIGNLPYPSEFTEELKERVREYWGRKCMFPGCGVPESECLTRLHVHHLDYDKKNCSEVNLIPLCNKHNGEVNKNRKHWEEYFTQLQISRIPEQIKERLEKEEK